MINNVGTFCCFMDNDRTRLMYSVKPEPLFWLGHVYRKTVSLQKTKLLWICYADGEFENVYKEYD